MKNPKKFDPKIFEQKLKNMMGMKSETEKMSAAKNTGKEMVEMLDKYEQNLENVRDKISTSEQLLTQEAKKSISTKDKTRAMRLLKKKKCLAQRRATLNSIMLQIDEMKDNIEACEEINEYYEITKESIAVIHKLQSQVSLEDLQNLEDQFEEMKENRNDIANLFENVLNENEQNLEPEYKDLIQEIENEKRSNLPNPNSELFNTIGNSTVKNKTPDLESEIF